MTEIELPCCGETAGFTGPLPQVVHCDGCSLDLEIAEDVR